MRNPSMRRTFAGAAILALTTMGLAACGGDGGSGADDKTVTILSSVDQPVQDGLEETLTAKLKADGYTVDWQKVDAIDQLIMTRIQGNQLPDIALIPQPGVVRNVVNRAGGKAVDLSTLVDKATLEKTMVPGTLDAGTIDGKLYGLLVSMNVKGLVFYPKKAFEKAGYEVPETIGDLEALTEQIKSDGGTPWCAGIESEAATGWPATDWFEILVAKYGGVDTYNSWVAGETKFDSEVVRQAAGEFEKLLFTDGNVPGGRKAIATTSFQTAGTPMFDAKPGCWMYNQGSFITGFFPKAVQSNLDEEVGVFGFPPASAGGENPSLGGGDLLMAFNDSAATKAAVTALSEPDAGEKAAGMSSFISPHKTFNMDAYPNEFTKQVAGVAYDSTAFLFDGSDQMPGEVGAGAFWKDITAWVAGQPDLDTSLKNIDAAWPAS